VATELLQLNGASRNKLDNVAARHSDTVIVRPTGRMATGVFTPFSGSSDKSYVGAGSGNNRTLNPDRNAEREAVG